MPPQLSPLLPSPMTASSSSPRSPRHVPLLSLAQPVIHLSDDLATEDEELRVGEIWNVISRAADIVKDGERLENLAWRHWGRPSHQRRPSSPSNRTASSASLHTPESEQGPIIPSASRSLERRSFGGALKLLLEEDNFKDWVSDAKNRLPPIIAVESLPPTPPVISVPDTPTANFEIRLVEPTPVPSRVGSLGGSMSASGGLLGAAAIPPVLNEDEETIFEENAAGPPRMMKTKARSPKKKNRFFINSSPNKGSGSESSHLSHPSPVAPAVAQIPVPPPEQHRRSSGESSGDLPVQRKKDNANRHVSISTMKGKFASEKRKAADALKAKTEAEDEEGGWEDEGEEEDEEWDDEPESPVKPKRPANHRKSSSRSGRSSSNLDLAQITRQISRRTPPKTTPLNMEPPPPPAPTPLKRMSKKAKAVAAAERAKIEEELDAQEKRKMFAKREIFGENYRQNSEGLLTNLFKRGGSMVDLTHSGGAFIRPSPTHDQLPSMSRSPAIGPNLLRSKSAVAIPVQTGVSVITGPAGMRTSDEAGPSNLRTSEERRPPPGLDLESSGEESEDDYLASSQTRRKIAELAAKRDARNEAKAQAQAQPVPGPFMESSVFAQPLSPTTRRRTIIMREMSESLRRNIILEREKSAGRRTSFATASTKVPVTPERHPASSSAVNLTQYGYPEPAIERRNSQPAMSRPDIHPLPGNNLETQRNAGIAPCQPPPDPPRRRTQNNVLAGGFLKPLTRVGEPMALGRVQSSATLSGMQTGSPKSVSPQFEAPAMQRRATDGPGRERATRENERERVRRELQKRSDTMDTSYRSHGW